MATDLIRYDLLVQEALRGVVRTVLTDAAKNGLQGDHHFFITFRTAAPGLRLSDRMRARYPEEMTIILQHQFWDLGVTDHAFEVGLSFSGKPERLLIPFAAITTFHDPSVEFGLKFNHADDPGAEKDSDAGPVTGDVEKGAGKRMLAAVESGGALTGSEAKGARPANLKPTEVKPLAGPKTSDPKTSEPKTGKPALAKVPDAAAKTPEPTPATEPQKVVSIDAFRKKP